MHLWGHQNEYWGSLDSNLLGLIRLAQVVLVWTCLGLRSRDAASKKVDSCDKESNRSIGIVC